MELKSLKGNQTIILERLAILEEGNIERLPQGAGELERLSNMFEFDENTFLFQDVAFVTVSFQDDLLPDISKSVN